MPSVQVLVEVPLEVLVEASLKLPSTQVSWERPFVWVLGVMPLVLPFSQVPLVMVFVRVPRERPFIQGPVEVPLEMPQVARGQQREEMPFMAFMPLETLFTQKPVI